MVMALPILDELRGSGTTSGWGLLLGGVLCLSFTILWVWLIPIFNRSFKGSTPKLTRVQQIGGGALFAVISLALFISGLVHLVR